MSNLDDALTYVETVRNALMDIDVEDLEDSDRLANLLNDAHCLLQTEMELQDSYNKLLKSFCPVELKNDLVSSWNELYEVYADVEDLDDEAWVNCRKTIIGRVEAAQNMLGKYVDEDDVLEELPPHSFN